MATVNQAAVNKAGSLPEHGPIGENGREILLSLKNVDITFGKGEDAVRAVQDASFDIYKGETFSLVGESGCGKTTVGRAVIRVNPLARGEIDYKGVRISGKIPRALDREVIRNIQMVFQDPAASLNERATVDYIISEGLYNFHLFENEADRVRKVEHMIEEVGLLPEHLTRYPHEFSGGQMLWKQAHLLDNAAHLLYTVGLVFEKMEIVKPLGHDVFHRGTLVQRGGRVLEHHLNIPDHLSVQRMGNFAGNRHSFIENLPRGAGINPDNRPADSGLARAGLPHQGECLTLIDVEGGVFYRPHRLVSLSEGYVHIADRQ